MGGDGSSRWGDYRKKKTTSQCYSIGLSNFKEAWQNDDAFGGRLEWKSGLCVQWIIVIEGDSPILTLDIQLPDSARKQRVSLQKTHGNGKAVRWWLTCPDCQRHVSKLFRLPQGALFACWKCQGLVYRSAQTAKKPSAWSYLFRGKVPPPHLMDRMKRQLARWGVGL